MVQYIKVDCGKLKMYMVNHRVITKKNKYNQKRISTNKLKMEIK